MDVPAIHQGHLAGCGTVDICSRDNGDGVADIGHGLMMDTRLWIVALIVLAVILTANLGGLWLVSTW